MRDLPRNSRLCWSYAGNVVFLSFLFLRGKWTNSLVRQPQRSGVKVGNAAELAGRRRRASAVRGVSVSVTIRVRRL